MKDRLIELFKSACDKFNDSDCTEEEALELLADHLLENGVIAPPCKIGQTVYQIKGTSIKKYKVDYFDIFKNSVNFTFKIHLIADNWSDFVFADDVGKTVFLTREDAEAKLKEGADNEHK